MKIGIVQEIHPKGYDVLKRNNLDYFVINNTEESHLIEK